MQPLDQPDRQNPYEDPICHETVDPDKSPRSLYRGMIVYFCSKQCKQEFDLNPQLWISVSHAELSCTNYSVS
jgi:YHS domain-containing protein